MPSSGASPGSSSGAASRCGRTSSPSPTRPHSTSPPSSSGSPALSQASEGFVRPAHGRRVGSAFRQRCRPGRWPPVVPHRSDPAGRRTRSECRGCRSPERCRGSRSADRAGQRSARCGGSRACRPVWLPNLSPKWVPVWHERRQARLMSTPRKRAVGAGGTYRLVFVDRLLATLVHLRHAVTHDVLACWFGVDRSTITRAVGEVRPLPGDGRLQFCSRPGRQAARTSPMPADWAWSGTSSTDLGWRSSPTPATRGWMPRRAASS